MQTIRVLRTQKTAIGMLHAGVAYHFDPKKLGHSAVAARLLDHGFGEEVTAAQLKKEKTKAEKLKSAEAAQTKEVDAKSASELMAAKAEIATLQDLLKAATDAGLEAAADVKVLNERIEKSDLELAQLKGAPVSPPIAPSVAPPIGA